MRIISASKSTVLSVRAQKYFCPRAQGTPATPLAINGGRRCWTGSKVVSEILLMFAGTVSLPWFYSANKYENCNCGCESGTIHSRKVGKGPVYLKRLRNFRSSKVGKGSVPLKRLRNFGRRKVGKGPVPLKRLRNFGSKKVGKGPVPLKRLRNFGSRKVEKGPFPLKRLRNFGSRKVGKGLVPLKKLRNFGSRKVGKGPFPLKNFAIQGIMTEVSCSGRIVSESHFCDD